MPAASREGDICSGHGCFPPTVAAEGSGNVFFNGKPALRVGDDYAPHCCGSCHNGAVIRGSSSVFINGQPAARIGDDISCGSIVAEGSDNIFIGG